MRVSEVDIQLHHQSYRFIMAASNLASSDAASAVDDQPGAAAACDGDLLSTSQRGRRQRR